MRLVRGDRLSPHFRKYEWACRCRRESCDAPEVSPAFIAKLEAFRKEWGKPLLVTSGVRCAYWNEKVGGAQHSKHLEGIAGDFLVETDEITAFVKLAERHGFGGIGVGKTFVHLDTRPGKARWNYD